MNIVVKGVHLYIDDEVANQIKKAKIHIKQNEDGVRRFFRQTYNETCTLDIYRRYNKGLSNDEQAAICKGVSCHNCRMNLINAISTKRIVNKE